MNARQLIRFFLISVLFSISLGSTPPLAEAWQAVTARDNAHLRLEKRQYLGLLGEQFVRPGHAA